MIGNDRVLRGQRRRCCSCTRKTDVATTEGTVARPLNASSGISCLRHGLLISTGVPGVYGRSGEFEDTVQRIDRLRRRSWRRRPPRGDALPADRQPGSLSNAAATSSRFPHLAGSVHSFAGDERAHRELLQAVEEGRDWSAALPHAGRGADARCVLSRVSRCSRVPCPRAAGWWT